MPNTRHFVDTGLISANFRQRFEDAGAFKRAVSSARWKALGAEVFNKKLFVPGDLWAASPYSLNNAMALSTYVTADSRVIGNARCHPPSHKPPRVSLDSLCLRWDFRSPPTTTTYM